MEAVQSAEGVRGTWMGALKCWRRCLGAAMPAENPLSSESGGAASGRWSRGRGEVEEEAEEGSATARCCQQEAAAAAAAGRSGPVEEEAEEGRWSA